MIDAKNNGLHLRWLLRGVICCLLGLGLLPLVATSSAQAMSMPSQVKISKTTMTSVTVSWKKVSSAKKYRVMYSTSSKMTNAKFKRVNSNEAVLTGLKANTKYYFAVRVITPEGKNLTAYTKPVAVTTPKTLPSPAELKSTSSSHTVINLSWEKMADVPGYRVQYSTSSKMDKPNYQRTTTNSLKIAGLKKGTTYYFRVRAIAENGDNLGPYSNEPAKVATPSDAGHKYLPTKVSKVSSVKPTSFTAAWESAGSGLYYKLEWSTSSDFSSAKSSIVKGTSKSITGLKEATKYYLRVRVSDSKGNANSPVSAVLTGSTQKVAKITVASYNVRYIYPQPLPSNELTWYQRRDAVVAAVKKQAPDVIGFQEASEDLLRDNNGTRAKVYTGAQLDLSQFEDLANRLGAPYRLTNTNRYNCQNPLTSVGCIYQDMGASRGVRIVYNADTLTLLDEGSKLLPIGPLRPIKERYLAWAVFEHKLTRKRFFFADIHLDSHTGTKYNTSRVAQSKAVLKVIKEMNPDKLPSYVVGDFNSTKTRAPANGPYDTFLKNGYVDPLGNYWKSTKKTKGATVEKRIHTNYNSYNDFLRKAPKKSYINGNYLDYILTSKGTRVLEWETVVNIDSKGKFKGVIGSDHNMIRATTYLP